MGDGTNGTVTGSALVTAARKAVEELAAEVLDAAVGDAGLADRIEALERLARMVQAEKLRSVAELRRRDAARTLGARSSADLLAERLAQSKGRARAEAEVADALADLPETAASFASGELGFEQAEVAAKAANELANAGLDAEAERAARARLDATCAEQGRSCDRNRLRERADEVLNDVHSDRLAERDRVAHRRRSGRVWRNDDGTETWQFRLPLLASAGVKATLRPLAGRDGDDDDRTPEQRLADALVSACDRAAATSGDGQSTSSSAAAAQVILITTPEALHGDPDAPPSLLDGAGPISTATARQACCAADITPVTMRNARVLDAGRTVRTATARQRLAVIARDRGCIGCGAAAARCQIHHIVEWNNGGATDEANLVLVCASCHHHIHHNGWQVRRTADGRHWIQRPAALQPAHHRRAS